MEKEILSLETAKKLADYEKLKKENGELKEKIVYKNQIISAYEDRTNLTEHELAELIGL